MFVEKLIQNTKGKGKIEYTGMLGEKREAIFTWNTPISTDELNELSTRYRLELPQEYIDFLKISNGGIVFNNDEDGGYKILGLQEAIDYTRSMSRIGLEKQMLIFMTALFSPDMLVFDMQRTDSKRYILDGDVGYPVKDWNYLKGGFNTLLTRMYQSDGAMYWRW